VTVVFRTRFAVFLMFSVLAAATSAAAQGNGHGHAYGHSSSPSGQSAARSSVIGPGGTGVRNFGSWLDDASLIGQGQGTVSFGFGYWKTPDYREFDLPTLDWGVGLSPRVQFGFSVPFYHAGVPGGPVARGFGDMYLNTKIQLRDPSTHGVGFAVVPILEVLSYAPRPDVSRVGWALPGTIEVQRQGWRVFGTAGYFSRGAVFASGAIEAALTDRAWLTGTISRSHSLEDDALSEALGLSPTRTDVTVGASTALTPAFSVFGSVGRTISRTDANSAALFFTGGVSVSFAAWQH
jgi:hypothetical protein